MSVECMYDNCSHDHRRVEPCGCEYDAAGVQEARCEKHAEDPRTNEQQMIDGDRLPVPPFRAAPRAEGTAPFTRLRGTLAAIADGRGPAQQMAQAALDATEAEAAQGAAPRAELDANVLQHAWIVLTAYTNPDRWEPDRYNCAAFLKAWMAEYARLTEGVDRS